MNIILKFWELRTIEDIFNAYSIDFVNFVYLEFSNN